MGTLRGNISRRDIFSIISVGFRRVWSTKYIAYQLMSRQWLLIRHTTAEQARSTALVITVATA
jgi:hypothetical protein